MPLATSSDQRAIADAMRSWAGTANPCATARAQETSPDAWRKHWPELAALGIFAVALPEALGGGGTVADLAAMVEAAARELTPGPLVSTAVAALVLSRSDSGYASLPRIATGELACGIGLHADGVCVHRRADGVLVANGVASPVLGADRQSMLVLGGAGDSSAAVDIWFHVEPDAPGLDVVELASGDFSRGLGEVRLTDVEIPDSHVLSGVSTDLVRDLLAVLFAAEASGVAGWCLDTAASYAKVREQFERPIGTFQAIKHMCAEMLCRAEITSAVAWDAAMADAHGDERPLAAAIAASVALDAAVETAKDCIQILGGIGFTWEHDAHLYLRRAVSLRQLLGGSAPWRRRVAALAMAGHRRQLHIDMTAHDDAGRDDVREAVTRIAQLAAPAQRIALAEAGYLTPHWPRPYGLDAGAAEQLVIDQELARAGVLRPDLVIGAWAAPTILQHGSPEQIDRFVSPTLRGDIVWCQLFSEPEAGSDLASLRTRAVRVDGGWRITGQKVWTSVAQRADWGICLARTDPDAPKHRGITYFLVDMRSSGLDIRPLREITGEALFNEVFMDDVFVPDDLVVADVNDGWRLARTTLANERVAMGGGSSLGDSVEKLLAHAGTDEMPADAAALDLLGGLVSTGHACSVLDMRAALRRLDGQDSGAQSSVRKLVGVRHRQAVAEAALDLMGTSGALDSEQLYGFLQTRCLTIAGGTTQVLLSLTAERILGLPRDS